MKKNKIVLAVKLLAIIAICLISFVGVYIQKENRMENVVKDFTLSKDLTGYREIMFKISDANKVLDKEGKEVGDTDTYDDSSIQQNEYTKSDEKINSEENRTESNYELVRKIVEKRLQALGVDDYNVSVSMQDGTLYIQVPENKMADKIVSNITETGALQLKDSEDGTVFISEKNLERAAAMYNTETTGTTVYLDLQFDKEGAKKLKELSENEYKTIEKQEDTENNNDVEAETEEEQSTETTETSTEESSEETSTETSTEETAEEEKQKKITLSMSGSDVTSTSFDEVMGNGRIDLTIGQASKETETINENLQSASITATILNNGVLPFKYKVEDNKYVKTDIQKNEFTNFAKILIVITAILFIYMLIKNGKRGIVAFIGYIGFIALFLLVLRYTNVVISISGIMGIIAIALINYVFNLKMLKLNEEKYIESYLKLLIKLIPILAISIVFCFIRQVALNSIGMVMFWGIILISVYNFIFNKQLKD